VTAAGAERRALRPLWMLATGAVLGAFLGTTSGLSPGLGALAVAVGAAAIAGALAAPRRWPLWLLAGLAIAGGRGLEIANQRSQLAAVTELGDAAALRVTATVHDGWVPTRWGRQATITVASALHDGRPIALSGRWRLEIRGATTARDLPAPGATVTTLVSIRGDEELPFLAAPSPRLVETTAAPRGLAALRDRLASAVLAAAGSDVRRIRSAEIVAALALGRRDLLAPERREGWRRSGLAHLLAVSGLHVGLVAGSLWLAWTAIGLHPRRVRWLLLATVPGYALLAGASPSAVRAAVMAVVYLGGRQLGRAVIPMATVLLAATALLFASPGLVTDAGFQLTVLVTAALVRWVPAVADWLPGPRRPAAIVAVPLVAQAAAGPIAAAHFHAAVPGALAANLLVPPLLAPTLTTALLSMLAAPAWPGGCRLLLDAVGIGERMLWRCGAPGRMCELVVPSMPAAFLGALAIAGWLALQPGRTGRLGAVAWCAAVAAGAGCWLLAPLPPTPWVELLPVADGLAATVATRDGVVLADGGRWRRQAAELLADGRVRRLSAVLASHPDEDHIGGLSRVLSVIDVERLVVPAWARSSAEMAPLLRTARRRGTTIVAVARGSVVRIGGTELLVLWPPGALRSGSDNDRSLVVQLVTGHGAVLIGADIDRAIEERLARSGDLRSRILIVPHHGSRGSCSEALLDAVDPRVVLIPAGPLNRHNHPHPEVLERLARRGLPIRYPIRDGRCGATFRDGRWVAFPAVVGE
jgi:competence protein ComEC